MKSAERVFAAMEHREPDRLPVDFYVTRLTGMHVQSYHSCPEHISQPESLLEREDIAGWFYTDIRSVFPESIQ